ncbi:YsnF/AvaK domain-containing protein [Telluria mixta]|uniref:YsnF/AvaK domain-containing protein n=1 Tax=Telluria mixta TaxID=34071 RepID=A0ABT2BY75_9BURK|nr:YsnF/AvaK domain-containing protein [Telluria mixta]MCS0630085.1 YsnF/AvaK domain-containing protein [Telluria mixta]WEM94602.1 YsnF/AvaK domain-containing protein [Telluria mixta]
MQHTLVAVFDNRSDAQNAMDELLASGFTRDNVYVSSADLSGTTTTTDTTLGTTHEEGVGASIKHFFENLFGSDNDEHATRYSTAVAGGQHVLTLTTSSEPEVERAADVIERFGPIDIDERHDLAGNAASLGTSAYQSQSSSTLAAGSMQSGTQAGNLSGSLSDSTLRSDSLQRDTAIDQTTGKAAIPVVQEEVRVGKRQVERGGVRVFSRLVETPVNETVSLREEHVSVERRPVDQPINPADVAALKDKTIELRETAEEAVVQKSARVVEEVVVGKEVSQRQEKIQDTVRHTEVEVQPLQGSALDDDTYYRNDWQTNYASLGGTYDDYAPAYRYGYDMRRDARYQGRNWDDVESDLRSDWDTRYGSSGSSTWERMKAAVRSGWNRMTS